MARVAMIAAFVIGAAAAGAASANDARLECTVSPPTARYRLFSTKNVWTVLELDTESGQLWQVEITVDSAAPSSLPVNTTPLAKGGRPGRFTLCPTGNMWNFVILDQETGRTWQAQFSMTDSERGIREISPAHVTGLTLVPAPK